MSRIGPLKSAVVLSIALVALAVGLTVAGPVASRQEPTKPAPIVTPVEPSACAVDEALSAFAVVGSSLEPAAAGGCKACKAQPWCGCVYQGHPRISCDPCCYQAYPAPICLS